MPARLYIYVAPRAPSNAVILRRTDGKKMEWEMIRWDIDTDTFTAGQWLRKKCIFTNSAAISPDGLHFAYQYFSVISTWECHAVVSRVPNFTAVYHTESAGKWDSITFSEDGAVIWSSVSSEPMEPRGDGAHPPLVPSSTQSAPTGYKPEDFTDNRGRYITTKDGVLFADGVAMYDTTAHTFEARAAI